MKQSLHQPFGRSFETFGMKAKNKMEAVMNFSFRKFVSRGEKMRAGRGARHFGALGLFLDKPKCSYLVHTCCVRYLLARRSRFADRKKGILAMATKKSGGQGIKSAQLDS